MDTVEIQKRKLNGSSGTWGAYLLDSDEYGTWFFAPRGTHTVGRSPDGSEHVVEIGAGSTAGPCDLLTLAPSEAPYVVCWSQNWSITIDVCTPITADNALWGYTDLELDLYLTRDGSRGIVDLDEFLDACEAGQITPEDERTALRTAGQVERLLRGPTEPFGDVGWILFDRAVSLGLDPRRRA